MAAKEKITGLVEQLEKIISECKTYEAKFETQLAKVHPRFAHSARNLIHYRTLRRKGRNRLQRKLANLGLSRLAKSESHVLPSLQTTQQLLQILSDSNYQSAFDAPEFSIKKSRRLLKRNVRNLLNKRPKRRRSRIMVTMPAEAGNNRQLVHDMIQAGMNAARVNCAHDDTVVWKSIIKNVRSVSKELKTPCIVAMDLGGPKIRTGAIEPGPKIFKARPPKNARGLVIKPADLWLGEGNPLGLKYVVPLESTTEITPVQLLHFTDARKKGRTLVVQEKLEGGYHATINKTSYFETGIKLYADAEKTVVAAKVGELPSIEGSVFLADGEPLRITAKSITAKHRSHQDVESNPLPEIQCTNTQVFHDVKVGESVVLDDGKFEGVIEELYPDHLIMRMTQVRGGSAKLKAEKGINFPKSKLKVRGLTAKDREDLKFVVEHADVVNMSFVNSSRDVDDLLDAIHELDPKSKIGVVLKIETEQAFRNLTHILLAGMQTHPLGIMIARGDLALEVGWLHLATTQREIMKLCHAAHVPDIWATQVFENLAKQGVPSRAEMTDVWVAQRSECVMLNKGPFIIEAIEMLDAILTKMEPYRDKNDDLLPVMERAMH